MAAPRWTLPAPLPGPIRTPRLEVRRYTVHDARAFFEALDGMRSQMLPWLSWAVAFPSLEATIADFETQAAREASPECNDFRLGMFDRTTGAFVGGTGLHGIDSTTAEAEVGYWVVADRRGHGLCFEGVRAVISSAFIGQDQGGWGLRRITIGCAEDNVASKAVIAKLGLPLESRRRQDRWIEEDAGGRFADSRTHAVLRDEWDIAAQTTRSDRAPRPFEPLA